MKTNQYFVDCVGPGWQPIVNTLIEEIKDLNTHFPSSTFTLQQVKEKFGGLRFYFDMSGDDGFKTQVVKLVDAATLQCDTTCEMCGNSGELRYNRPWLKVLCDEHNK